MGAVGPRKSIVRSRGLRVGTQQNWPAATDRPTEFGGARAVSRSAPFVNAAKFAAAPSSLGRLPAGESQPRGNMPRLMAEP